MPIRPLLYRDKPAVMLILQATPEFLPEEVPVAEEVLDVYLADPSGSGYYCLAAEEGARLLGYICYGPTPLTRGTWDIYWMAVAPDKKGQGVGSRLLYSAEEEIKKAGGRLIVLETSGKPEYENTRGFYRSRGYREASRISDYYAPGDDLVVFRKDL